MSKLNISRRDFLKAAGVSAAALGLTACGGSSSSTAASGSHFSKMLTPEEEKIMREIIREFMA